jgi:HEPN domain-containing protein
MIRDKDILYWVSLSRYDLNTAKAMLASRRYLYVLFTCQQAIEKIIEKMLKALVVQNTRSFPPKIHDLVKLLTIAGIEAPEEKKEFLGKLNYYYLETRYPAELSEISKLIKRQIALDIFNETRKTLTWLKSKVQ